jgi:hypothetical protein
VRDHVAGDFSASKRTRFVRDGTTDGVDAPTQLPLGLVA